MGEVDEIDRRAFEREQFGDARIVTGAALLDLSEAVMQCTDEGAAALAEQLLHQRLLQGELKINHNSVISAHVLNTIIKVQDSRNITTTIMAVAVRAAGILTVEDAAEVDEAAQVAAVILTDLHNPKLKGPS